VPNATFLKEIRAGITTFATMAYIISVNVGTIVQGHMFALESRRLLGG
jgi:xanthine/uracil/vitamin C permease (AzgA family)